MRTAGVAVLAGLAMLGRAHAQDDAESQQTSDQDVDTIPVPGNREPQTIESDDSPLALDEYVVTAQKTRQTLKEVPASVTAISGQDLENSNIVLPNDLNAYIPNVQLKVTPYLSEIRIRGYGTTISNLGAEPSVGVVIDGVYYGRNTFLNTMLYDIDSFEVIRGPQGTLFGKNTVAGVLNLTTVEPGLFPEGNIRLVGEREAVGQRIAEGGVTVPFSDTASVRVGGKVLRIDGLLYNTLLRRPEADFIGTYGRVNMVLPEFGNGGRVAVIANVADQALNNNAFQLAQVTPTVLEYMRQFDPQVETNPRNELVSSNLVAQARIETRTVQANATYPLNGLLGVPELELTSISSIARTTTVERDLDFDFSPVPAIAYTIQQPSPFRQLSQELRLSGFSDSLLGLFGETEFVVGAYFYEADQFTNEFIEIEDLEAITGLVLATQADNPGSGGVVPLPGQGSGFPVPPAVVDFLTQVVQSPVAAELFAQQGQFENALLTADQTQTAYALFGQTTTRLVGNLFGIAGLRLGWEDKEALLTSTAPDGAIFVPFVVNQENHVSRLSRSEDEISPKVGLRYDFGDHTSVYTSWARGFKSGGFNGLPLNPNNLEFEPERADSYEVGAKTRLFGNSLQANLSIFHTDFEDLQVSTFTGTTIAVLNAASARSRGAELDIRWLPLRAVQVQGGVGYTDAVYTSYPNAPAPATSDAETQGVGGSTPQDAPGFTGNPRPTPTQDLTGRTLQNAPEFTVNLRPTVFLPGWNSSFGFAIHLEALYTSERFLDLDLDPVTLQEDTLIYNARLSVGSVNQDWAVTVSFQNLTDERPLNQITDLPVAAGSYGAVSTTVPRTVYGALSFRF